MKNRQWPEGAGQCHLSFGLSEPLPAAVLASLEFLPLAHGFVNSTNPLNAVFESFV
jgi:hypothetical protein